MKPIKLTETEIQRIVEEFKASLNVQRNSDSITFKHDISDTALTEKIKLIFAPMAWLKMHTLVNACDSEIAWHGVVSTSENRKIFTISEILLYPQTVANATVQTDEVKYEAWHQALDDNSYNNLRFQAHSHVNMSAFASGQDASTYSNMLQTLSDDSYYIFMIINKKGERWINIYDLLNNAIYETKDIEVSIEGLDSNWYKEQYAQHITTRTYAYVPPTPPASLYGVSKFPATTTNTLDKHPAVMSAAELNKELREKTKQKSKDKKNAKNSELEKLAKDPFGYKDDSPSNRTGTYGNNYGRSIFKDESEAYYEDDDYYYAYLRNKFGH